MHLDLTLFLLCDIGDSIIHLDITLFRLRDINDSISVRYKWVEY